MTTLSLSTGLRSIPNPAVSLVIAYPDMPVQSPERTKNNLLLPKASNVLLCTDDKDHCSGKH